jgi:perosamine synthetase
MLAHVQQLLVSADATLRTALAVIDRNGCGVAFAVDGEGTLEGLLTDGDIRRALLRGLGLEASVREVMRVDCVSLPHDAAPQDIMAALGDRIAIVPLMDKDRRPVDYASHYRHHHLPIAEPELSGNELDYIVECVRTNWVSSQGPFISRFEEEFARCLGVPHALAVSNGTAALHLALAALEIGQGDEVILPDLTFAATINSILYVGATPVLVDVTKDTWTLDPDAVERVITPKTKAILVVHLYGQPCAMDRLMQTAARHRLFVIEDAAEALGASYHGRAVGAFGDAAAFSFYGNKLITTGEGGMVTFKDGSLAQRARVLRDHGMDRKRRYWHEEVGYNYRLTNVQAAIGVAQLERLNAFIDRKLAMGSRYSRNLASLGELILPAARENVRNVFWLYSFVMDPTRTGLGRDELMERLLLNGIETRPLFYPLHQMPPYRQFDSGRPYPNSEWLSANGLSLPSAVTLKDEDIDYVTGAIRRAMDTRMITRMLEEAR